jgi:hypothetical protein
MLPMVRRSAVVAVSLGLAACALKLGCATESMWRRQVRRSLVSTLVGDTTTARELSVVVSLAESPPRDLAMVARTLVVLAEVEILDEKWREAETHLRRAAEVDSEQAGSRGTAEHP